MLCFCKGLLCTCACVCVKCICVCVPVCSAMSDSVTPWTIACQAHPSMEFSRQEYWSGLPFPPPGDLPNPGIFQTHIPVATALAGRFFTTEPPWKPVYLCMY